MHSSKFPQITTGRLLLRQFEENDLESVYKGLSDPDIIKYYGVSYQTLEETKEQMKFFEDLEKEGTGIWWAICSLDNTTFYGAGGPRSDAVGHVADAFQSDEHRLRRAGSPVCRGRRELSR